MKSNVSELSLWLDSYDDIFSDFDSRNYHKRRISEDFLEELKASLKYKKERTDDLVLLLPAEQRRKDIEPQIVTSIKDQFHNRFLMFNERDSKIRLKGILYLVIGIVIMAIDSVIAFWLVKTYPVVTLRIILEPAGWFLMWNGLDLLSYDYRKAKHETNFYRNVDHLKIHFRDIEA